MAQIQPLPHTLDPRPDFYKAEVFRYYKWEYDEARFWTKFGWEWWA
jgi:hypothetical protein